MVVFKSLFPQLMNVSYQVWPSKGPHFVVSLSPIHPTACHNITTLYVSTYVHCVCMCVACASIYVCLSVQRLGLLCLCIV